MKNKNLDQTNERHLNTRLIVAILFVSLIWASIFLLNIWLLYEKDDFNGGTLGDSFGTVNALFSGLAFAFLIYTAYLQKEELKLQRKELQDNRAELKRSADAHNELVELTMRQNELMIQQNRLMLNINIEKLHPQFDDMKVDLSNKELTRIEIVVRNRALRITDILDDNESSILDDGAEVMRPYDYFDNNELLSPSTIVVIEFMPIFSGIIIEFESSSEDTYWQEISLGEGGYSLNPPSLI